MLNISVFCLFIKKGMGVEGNDSGLWNFVRSFPYKNPSRNRALLKINSKTSVLNFLSNVVKAPFKKSPQNSSQGPIPTVQMTKLKKSCVYWAVWLVVASGDFYGEAIANRVRQVRSQTYKLYFFLFIGISNYMEMNTAMFGHMRLLHNIARFCILLKNVCLFFLYVSRYNFHAILCYTKKIKQ